MNEPDSQDSSQQVSAKIDEIILGLKWMFVLLIVLISIPNIQIALSISWFAKGFAEALPGMMLPLVTSTLITLPTFFFASLRLFGRFSACLIYFTANASNFG